jgi:TorA maturation chaperone TorD
MTTRNDIRAERAQAALQSYVEAKGEVFENSSSEIADLIADLLHLAARLLEGENTAEETVERCLRLARMHFDAEHNNPEEEAA